MPVRVPRYDIKLAGKSIDDYTIRHLIDSVECDREIGKFDSLTVRFVYGPELAKAYPVIQHGSVVEFLVGYGTGKLKRVMFGFHSGIKIQGSTKGVTLKVVGYLASLDQGKKERQVSGKTLNQILALVLEDHPSLVLGTVDNGDMVMSEEETQTAMTDYAFLEKIASHFGMFIRLEESNIEGTWGISMRELGTDAERHVKPYILDPRIDEQDFNDFGHLKEFDPESNILGVPVDLSIVSVNPEYRFDTETTTIQPEQTIEYVDGGNNQGPGDPFAINSNSLGTDDHSEIQPEVYQTSDPALYGGVSGVPASGALGLPSFILGAASSFGESPAEPTPAPLTASYESGGIDAPSTPTILTRVIPAVYGSQTNRTYEATTVVFKCFGQVSTIQFSEDVSSEEAQVLIAEAIKNGQGLDFVVVKSAQLSEGDPDLDLGQVRECRLNDYPLYGEAFSGDYNITKVTHSIDRSASFLTRFSGNRNSLTIPEAQVPLAVPLGATPVVETEEVAGLFRPNLSNILGASGNLDPNSLVLTGGSPAGILGVSERAGSGLNIDLANSAFFMGGQSLPSPEPTIEFPFDIPFMN